MSKSTISTFELFKLFPDQDTARAYLESRRWPDGAQCPFCGLGERITARKDGFYRCNPCQKDFTVRTGTIFERSHVPLHKWIYAMYLFVTSRKGISSLQLSKEIGITQKSAWFLLQRLREIAKEKGAHFDIIFFDTPLEECIERDLKRHNSVGEKVIRDMHKQFLQKSPDPIEQNPDLPHAIIVDIDGTLALKGDRSPYDWLKVGSDAVNRPVANLVNSIKNAQTETQIILVSGRDAICEQQTIVWLHEHRIFYNKLFMRPEGNCEKDSIIKRRIFDENIRDKYFVKFVLDDRNQVVDMWRDLGLTCFQVAPGDF